MLQTWAAENKCCNELLQWQKNTGTGLQDHDTAIEQSTLMIGSCKPQALNKMERYMIRKLLVSGIALSTAMTAFPVLAQTSREAIQEIQVTSNSRRSEGLADINAAVSVIGQQELDLVSHTHYQEVLNRMPGVNINRNNGQESLIAIRSPVLTGAGACGSFLTAENGIPLRSNGFCNVNEMFDAHTENAASIEVVRGPGSAFWGSNAMHGMINVVLPKPGDAGEMTLESGPEGSYRVKGRYGNDYGNLKQLLLVTGVNEEGYRDNSGVDQQKVSWLYNYTTANGSTLDGGFTFSNLNQETAGYVVGPNAYKGSLRDTNPNPEAYRDSVNTRVWTSVTQTIDEWEIVLTPYFREANMNFIQHFLPGLPIEDSEHRSLGLQSAGYRNLANGATLAVGVDLENTTGKLKQFQPTPTVGSAFLRNTIPQGLQYDYEVDSRQMGAFITYEQSLSENWDMSLGLRLENMKYYYDNQMIDGRTKANGVACGFGGCRYSRPADRTDGFSDISPKLGLSYSFDENHSLQMRIQNGFRAPQASELYRLQNNQTVADLESVQLDSYELGMTGSGDNWDYMVTYYYMDKENEIITDSARINLNGVHTEHRGIEVTAGYDISETLSVRGAFNLASHTVQNSQDSNGAELKGNDVDGAPNTFGNLHLQWQPNSQFLAELEWVNMGSYYSNPENTASYEGHDLFNLRAQYQMSDALDLSVNLLNITDVEYAERADWTSFTGDRYFPGEPARAFVALTWKFR